VDTLTSAEKAIAARRLAAVRPVVTALAGIAAPEASWELCRDELSGVDVATGDWDIRARWFGVVVWAQLDHPAKEQRLASRPGNGGSGEVARLRSLQGSP